MRSNCATFFLLSLFFIFFASLVHISARPTAFKDNNRSIGCDTASEYNITGEIGENVSIGNVSDIHVSGTNRGCIGGRNKIIVTGKVPAKSNIGNVNNVRVLGSNTGSIGSGNRIVIS